MKIAADLYPNSWRHELSKSCRKFSQFQIDCSKEYLNSSVTCCSAIELFNVILAELKIFSNAIIFSNNFIMSSKVQDLDKKVKNNLETSMFVDTLGKIKKFYHVALIMVMIFFIQCSDDDESKWLLLNVFLNKHNDEK